MQLIFAQTVHLVIVRIVFKKIHKFALIATKGTISVNQYNNAKHVNRIVIHVLLKTYVLSVKQITLCI